MHRQSAHDGRTRQTAHYRAADINDKLIINFRDIGHTMRFLYEGKGSQDRILIVLLETGRITQRELTKRLGIQPGSASEVIAKLEHAGLIARTPNGEDRRTTDVFLTDAGRARAAIASEQRLNRHEQMFSCLSAGEKEQLLALLERVNDDWEGRYREMERAAMPGSRAHHVHHKQGPHPEQRK